MENGNKIYVDWIDKVKVLQKAVIKNKSGLILALKRSDDARRPLPGCWDLPGGRVEANDIKRWKEKSGHSDNSDILVNALRREIKEESNLEISEIKTIYAGSQFSQARGIFVVAISYVCDALNEDKIKLSDEHCQYRWVDKDNFLNLEIGDDSGLIKSILKNYAKRDY